MNEKIEIRTIETVRRIRDEIAAILSGKTDEEIIAFFREAAEQERKAYGLMSTKGLEAHTSTEYAAQ